MSTLVSWVSRTCWNTLQLPVQYVYFFGATAKHHSEKWITHASLCCFDPLIPSHVLSSRLFCPPSLFLPLTHTFPLNFFSAQTLVPSCPPILLLCRFPFSPYLIMFNISYLPFFPLLVSLHLSISLFRFNSTFSLFSLSLSLLSYSLYFSPLVSAPSLAGPTLILYSTAFCCFPLHTLLYLLHHTPPSILSAL